MAMAVAKLCPETGQTVREAAEAAGVTKTRVGQARIVLQHAPSLVDLVIREEMGLDAAGGANRINGRTRASPAPHPNYPRPGLAHVRR